ncbi:MAG: GNAT family N-acetyltransferase [Pseudoramibacter sp.]
MSSQSQTQRAESPVACRLFCAKDEPRILEVLNQSIVERKVTAQLTPATMAARRDWFAMHRDPRYPIFVADQDGEVLGWMAVTPYRGGREGFSKTCELSYYLDRKCRHRGIGSALMAHALETCRELGYRHVLLIIFEHNLPSQGLAKKFGFTVWGRFPNIVDIDGRIQDCLQMGRDL